MSKHTPGPWVEMEFDEWGIDTGGDNTFTFVGPKDGEPVAIVVVTSSFGLDEEIDANARLIAAAPDLLEALKNARLWLDVTGGFDLIGIDAVIAKAEGRS